MSVLYVLEDFRKSQLSIIYKHEGNNSCMKDFLDTREKKGQCTTHHDLIPCMYA